MSTSNKSSFLFLYRKAGSLDYAIVEADAGSDVDDVVDILREQVGGNDDDTWVIYGFESPSIKILDV